MHFQNRGSGAGEFQGKGLYIREENGFVFKSSSSLHSAQWRGYAKAIKSKILKAYQAQKKVTALTLLFLDVLTPSLSPLSPKGCAYSVAIEISKASSVREKGISREGRPVLPGGVWSPQQGLDLEPFLCFMDLLPFLGVFLLNAECTGWSCSVVICGHLQRAEQRSCARRVQDSILYSQGETGPPSGMGVLLTVSKEVQLKPFADKDAAGGAETTSCKNRYRFPAPGQ